MLRTIVIRHQALSGSLKRAARSNVTRCLSTELLRRKQSNKISTRKSLPVSSQCIIKRFYADYPSHIKVNLPALSPTMESGNIISWAKKEGDKLSEGDLLCEIETDKATMSFETPEEGYLAKILIPEGAKGVAVGKLLCLIVESQDAVAAFKDFKDDSPAITPKRQDKEQSETKEADAPAPAAAAAAPAPAAPAAAPAAPAAPAAGGRVYASPFAKRIAELRNIRLGGQGSGLYNSLKSGDVGSAGSAPAAAPMSAPAPAPAPAPGAAYVDIPVSAMRGTIAKRLSSAKQTIPHYQLSMTVNVEKLQELRKEINHSMEKSGVKLSVNDFIIKAVASSCKRLPAANAYWMDTYIRQFSNVDVSVAVATPTGLITPIIFNADSRGIIDISRSVKELVGKAKEGKLQPNEFQGGTVTVSNLGMFGITSFNAIVNPPQSLILACGGLQQMLMLDDTEPKGFRAGNFVTFTASADHRVIDGAVGAEWMKIFKENIENPAHMIL